MREQIDGSEIQATPEFAALSRDVNVRVLNCSASGCLLETTAPLAIGTVAVLRVVVADREFDDAVQVIRQQRIEGAGEIYHVGTKFLVTTPPYIGSLRYFMRCDPASLTASLRSTQ